MNSKVSFEGYNKIFRGVFLKVYYENNLVKGIDINDDMVYFVCEVSVESVDLYVGVMKLVGVVVESKFVSAKKKARKRFGEGDELDRLMDDVGVVEKSSEV